MGEGSTKEEPPTKRAPGMAKMTELFRDEAQGEKMEAQSLWGRRLGLGQGMKCKEEPRILSDPRSVGKT